MKVLLVAGRWAKNIEKSEKFLELRKTAEVVVSVTADPKILKNLARDVDIIITGAPINAEIINSASKLKIIQTTSVGYDRIDLEAALKKGISICNVAEANANSVAELVFGLIIDVARRVSAHDHLMKSGGWGRVQAEKQVQIRHKTLGIIGLGAIGSRVAQIGKNAFNLNILAYDPYIIRDRADQFGAELVDLASLLKKADIITVHVPLNEETMHMIDENEFNLMKQNAIFINASRGPVVNEKALIRTLKEGRINGAGLDVFEIEPLPEDSELRKLNNVVLVPHIGSSSEALTHMVEEAIDNVIRITTGKQPFRIKTPEIYYKSPLATTLIL